MSKEKTKFGKFIEKAGSIFPEILGVGVKLATGNVAGAMGDVGSILKSKAEKDERAKQLWNEFENDKFEFYLSENEQITDRWKSDNDKGSKLSKVVRPITLLYLVTVATVLSILDSIQNITFKVAPNWVELFGQLLMVTIVAYFGSRGVEKFNGKAK